MKLGDPVLPPQTYFDNIILRRGETGALPKGVAERREIRNDFELQVALDVMRLIEMGVNRNLLNETRHPYRVQKNIRGMLPLFGKVLDFNQTDLRSVALATLLHDIGKRHFDCHSFFHHAVITRMVWDPPVRRRLTELHQIKGKEIAADRKVLELEELEFARPVIMAVCRHHHDPAWKVVKNAKLTPQQRLAIHITHISDVFDALTKDEEEERDYRLKKSVVETAHILRHDATVKPEAPIFEPQLVELFMQHVEGVRDLEPWLYRNPIRLAALRQSCGLACG